MNVQESEKRPAAIVKPGYTGFKRIVKATGFSIAGLRAAWRQESAFRQECVLALALVPCAFWLAETWTQAALLIAATGLVLVVELLNSAVEAVVDRLGDEWHELAGRAKDMGSAAVFVGLVLLAATWALVAWIALRANCALNAELFMSKALIGSRQAADFRRQGRGAAGGTGAAMRCWTRAPQRRVRASA